jgi:hypothetical protein
MEQKVNRRQTFVFLWILQEHFHPKYEYSRKRFLPGMCSVKIIFAFLGFRFVWNLRDAVQVASSSIIQCSAAQTIFPWRNELIRIVMEIWLGARSSGKRNGLCEGNTKMYLEGKHDFKWIDWLFFFLVETIVIRGSIIQVVCCLIGYSWSWSKADVKRVMLLLCFLSLCKN